MFKVPADLNTQLQPFLLEQPHKILVLHFSIILLGTRLWSTYQEGLWEQDIRQCVLGFESWQFIMWTRGPDIYSDGNRVQNGESCLVLIGKGTGEQLQAVDRTVDSHPLGGFETQLEHKRALRKVEIKQQYQ